VQLDRDLMRPKAFRDQQPQALFFLWRPRLYAMIHFHLAVALSPISSGFPQPGMKSTRLTMTWSLARIAASWGPDFSTRFPEIVDARGKGANLIRQQLLLPFFGR
jgi:hypothetical protein